MRKPTHAVLEDIPNIGPSIAANLRQIGIREPADLAGQAPDDLYRAVCVETGTRQDPCLLDVFMAAVSFMNGDKPRPWWHYTKERKRRFAAVTAPSAAFERAEGAVDRSSRSSAAPATRSRRRR